MREEDKKQTFIAEVPAELPMEKELLRREELDRVIVGNENAEVELPTTLPA